MGQTKKRVITRARKLNINELDLVSFNEMKMHSHYYSVLSSTKSRYMKAIYRPTQIERLVYDSTPHHKKRILRRNTLTKGWKKIRTPDPDLKQFYLTSTKPDLSWQDL